MRNAQVADMFDEIADYQELAGENFFKVRAHRRAAETIRDLGVDIATLVEADRVRELDGVGEAIAGKIRQCLESGTCAYLEELRKRYPATIRELLRVPGLGPKKVAQLYQELGIVTVDDLACAAREDRLSGLKGMGKKTQERILRGIDLLRRNAGRVLLNEALEAAETIVSRLRALPEVKAVQYAGSLRRWRETIGDVDLLVTADHPGPIMDAFTTQPEITEVLAHGETKSSIVFGSGLQVDLRAVPAESFGAACQYFTGSKDHNVKLRERAVRRGLKINEYGVFAGNGTRVAGETEESVYEAVGLPWIPPELRESRGELEAAEAGSLPHLVELADLQGDVHLHTVWSDGHNTVEEMAQTAAARGYRYLAITDHSKALAMAHGLDEERLLQQIEEIRALDETLPDIRLLCGIELDILGGGELDLAAEVLSRLDVIIGSVHSRFAMPAEEMTARLIAALQTGFIDILAHPTGRLLGQREGYRFDLEAVLDCAAEYGVAMEINAYPQRLDLNDVGCRLAAERGVAVAISTDAHAVGQLDFMRYGVGTARRGWLQPENVLNTVDCEHFLETVKRKRTRQREQ